MGGSTEVARMTFLRQKLVKMDCKGLFSCLLTVAMGNNQGLSGRYFQLRDGSGSGIAKNFGFGFGYGSGTGICTIYLINRVLSGNKNIDRFFLGISIWHFLFEYMDAARVQNFPKVNSH